MGEPAREELLVENKDIKKRNARLWRELTKRNHALQEIDDILQSDDSNREKLGEITAIVARHLESNEQN